MMKAITLSDEEVLELEEAKRVAKFLELETEVCGYWLWIIGGETRLHKTVLKQKGFKWAPQKKKWFFRPSTKRSFSRGNWEMDKIRMIHGSERV